MINRDLRVRDLISRKEIKDVVRKIVAILRLLYFEYSDKLMYTITKSVIRNEQYALAINKMSVSGKR